MKSRKMELIKQSNATLSIHVTIGTADKHRRQDAQGEAFDTYFQLLMTREVLTHTHLAQSWSFPGSLLLKCYLTTLSAAKIT